MKGRILAGALSVSLLLTGCASMLTREYGSVEPHSATLVSEGDANTLRAESYQDVVNGLIYFINRGAESGSIRFDGEEPDVRALLDEACLEVVQEDPLGAYAVEYIKYNVAPIVGSYEADIHITYRRSREQVAAITDATGASAIRSELSEALAAFSPEVVLRISYFEEDEAYLRQLVREAYLSDPASALGMPEAEIAMYPESGPRRIVEILLTYPKPRELLESQRNSLRRESAWRRSVPAPLSGSVWRVWPDWPEHTTRREAPPPMTRCWGVGRTARDWPCLLLCCVPRRS